MEHPIDISRLSPAECILLAEKLWDQARVHSGHVSVTQGQRDELNRRLDAFERGDLPPGESWNVVDAWLSKL